LNAPRDLGASHDELRTAELQADAALNGETVARAAVRRARAALDAQRPGGVSGATWRAMSLQVRELLVSMATTRRDVEAAALTPWQQLPDEERQCIGSLAREWRRQLEGAGWLR